MFVFNYKLKKNITVLYIEDDFYFNLFEIKKNVRPYFKNEHFRNTTYEFEYQVLKRNYKGYMKADETLVYINYYLFHEELETYIMDYVFPALQLYKDTLNKKDCKSI